MIVFKLLERRVVEPRRVDDQLGELSKPGRPLFIGHLGSLGD
jgi:hypothetical protein